MGIFYQSSQLAGRIENLAALMFAFVAIVPVIRGQIPPNRTITFIEYLVYLITFTTLICLIQGLYIREDTKFSPKFDDPYFLVSLIISALSLFIILVFLILHKFRWKPSYLKDYVEPPSPAFHHENWRNLECEKYFLKFFDNRRVKPLIYHDKTNIWSCDFII